MSKKNENVITSIYLAKNQYDELEKLSVHLEVTKSELIRDFISKGLSVNGYAQDVDIITGVIRQELNAIYRPEEIKNMMSQEVDRIAKMLMKVGKMDAGTYFLLVKLILNIWQDPDLDGCLDMVRDTQDLGIKFMQLSDGDINRFLQDTENLLRIARGLGDQA